jgi:hypothetical protein
MMENDLLFIGGSLAACQRPGEGASFILKVEAFSVKSVARRPAGSLG